MSCDEESVECGASEAGRMKLFVQKGFKKLGVERVTCCFSYGKYSD